MWDAEQGIYRRDGVFASIDVFQRCEEVLLHLITNRLVKTQVTQ